MNPAKKQVTWQDASRVEAKYKELYDKIENNIKPMTTSEFSSSETANNFESLQRSTHSLREELEVIARTKESLDRAPALPSASLRKKHEKLLSEIQEEPHSYSVKITWRDIVTRADVQRFLGQYFPRSDSITVDDFLTSLEFEFADLMQDEYLREEVVDVLSVDRGLISLNALELFTRDKGLKASLQELQEQIEERFKASKKELNENIYQELNDIKNMLNLKTRELDQKEAELDEREQNLLEKENQISQVLADAAAKMTQELIAKAKLELTVQMKRLKGLERNVSEMLKLARTKAQSASKAPPRTPADSTKLRSRITCLEKANEHMKERMVSLETENKADKALVAKMTEELARVKARNSMLEQSVTAKPKPSQTPVDREPVREPPREPLKESVREPEPKPKGLTPETKLAIETLHSIFSCIQITLPVYAMPGSPRSLISGVSKRAGGEEGGPAACLGEVLFPAFNTVVPQLAELIPYVHKYKDPEVQLSLVSGLWELVIYAWNAPSEQSILPSNLEFSPTTELWTHKIPQKKVNQERKPLYQLFHSPKVHKVLVFYFSKFVERTRSKHTLHLSLLASMLTVLFATSEKTLVRAISFIRDTVTGSKQERAAQILLADLPGSLVVLASLLGEGTEASVLASEIFLTLTMDSVHYHQLLSQCVGELASKCIHEACRRALGHGIRSKKTSELEENLVIFLQKLSTADAVKPVLKAQGLAELASQRVNAGNCADFLASNLNSIIRNLS